MAPVLAVKVPVFYGVGASLQYEAIAAKAVEASDFQEFLQAYNAYRASKAQQVKKPADTSIVATKCASCHGTDLTSPKGDLYLDLSAGVSADHITNALRKVRDNKMPPGKPLTDAEKAQLMQELLEHERKEE